MQHVLLYDTRAMMRWFLSAASDVATNQDPVIVQENATVLQLLSRDYTVSVIRQELCGSYPPTLFVLNDSALTWDDFSAASHARARTRFAVPVLTVLGKHVCRSATLSVSGEAAFNAVSSFLFAPKRASMSSPSSPGPSREVSMVGRNREADCQLLLKMRVATVFDLMKEQKKKKYGVIVASSEKADTNHRYDWLQLCGVPFPGTEGFVRFSDRDDASVVPSFGSEGEDAIAFFHEGCFMPSINWSKWMSWSLQELTLNYLKVMLSQLGPDKTGGILIHCLSGWDRTPLFVGLIRCVAWAEGLAHASLNTVEMLHLTLAYDWLLFRHRLADRMARREEVLYYAFYILTLVALDDSVRISPACDLATRREKLLLLQSAFMTLWSSCFKR